MADVIAKRLFTIFEKSWLTEKIETFFKKARKKDWWNYRLVSFVSVLVKITMQILLEETLRYMQDEKVTQDSQYGFTNGNCTWPICWSSTDGVTTSVDKGRATDLSYSDFCKAFDMVSQNILISELKRYGFDGWNLLWIKSWMDSHRKEKKKQKKHGQSERCMVNQAVLLQSTGTT